jgi:hypothetical protein
MENIVTSLIEYKGVKEADLIQKLICFGINKTIIFQGVKTSVITQLLQKHAPYLNGVHCMAHRTNLVIATLSSLR